MKLPLSVDNGLSTGVTFPPSAGVDTTCSEHVGRIVTHRAHRGILRAMSEHEPGTHATSGLPDGTQIIHNPSEADRDKRVGAAEGSELLGHHGRRFHLIEGSHRKAIEVTHFVLVRRRLFRRSELVLDRTLYVLPEETSTFEARRIGQDLVRRHPGRLI
jgi:hypothetical protein